jgi:hypothetical protein
VDANLPRCAVLAEQLGERPTGTASRISSVLLIEHAGPWPVDVRERVLAECFGPSGPEMLDNLHVKHGLRALVVRRPGRAVAPVRPSVFVGGFRPGEHWLERFDVGSYAELGSFDLAGLSHGKRGFGAPVDHPLFLVCVHGRKDACCAIKGRPVANALAEAYPENTWQCTHFGGDRWAGNLLVAPHGFMYGQLTPTSALPVAEHAGRGEIALSNLRGRAGIAPFAQVAEITIRERTGLSGIDEVLADAPVVHGDQASVEVRAAGSLYRVEVRRRPLGVNGHSLCSGEAHPHRFDVLGVETGVTA